MDVSANSVYDLFKYGEVIPSLVSGDTIADTMDLNPDLACSDQERRNKQSVVPVDKPGRLPRVLCAQVSLRPNHRLSLATWVSEM